MKFSSYSAEALILRVIGSGTVDLQTVYVSMRSRIGFISVENFESRFLQPLREAGFIAGTTDLSVTPEGHLALEDASVEARKAEAKWRPPFSDYQGTELGRTCQRPGAYDFMNYPSMIGNTLYPYRGNSNAQ